MHRDERDLLEVLQFELEFLDKGGYGRSPREPWSPIFIFEDSPACMNYDCKESPAPCSDCVLMQLVPPEFRFGKIPCRQIPLNASAETLDSLYRYADQHEIEETFRTWLVATIAQLKERRRDPRPDAGEHLPASGESIKGTALHQNLHPKCANPACPTAFHWTGGGKFFRFRPEQISASTNNPAEESPTNLHGVRHYWLCERCSHVFTLVHEEGSGDVLKLMWPELPVAEAQKKVSAA